MRRTIILAGLMAAGFAHAQQTTVVIPLQCTDARQIAAILGGERVAPTPGEIHDSRQNWVNAFAERVTQRLQTSRRSDQPGWVYGSDSIYSPWEQVGPEGVGGGRPTALLPEGIDGPPIALPDQNALLVKGTPAAIDQLKEIITLLDVHPKMVNVEVRLQDNPRTDANEWGMDLAQQVGDLLLRTRGNVPAGGLQVHTRAGNTDVTTGRDRRTSQGQVLTSASVTTESNFPAVISFGRMLPIFQTDTTYDQYGNRNVDTTVDAVFVGTELFVQPRINNDNTVTMYLRPTFIEAVGQITGPNGISLPITETLGTVTQVTVPDGETLQIGGFERGLRDMNQRYSSFLMERETQVDSHPALFVTPTIIHEVPTAPPE